MRNLPDKYNVRIIRAYGAAGHGKGLTDAITNFSAKPILRRDIATRDICFKTSPIYVNILSLAVTVE